MYNLNSQHFEIFKNNFEQSLNEEHWAGFKVKEWWEYVEKELDPSIGNRSANFKSEILSRNQIKTMCSDSTKSDFECMVSIMAWGGQNRKHGIKIFGQFDKIKSILSEMRESRISHLEAYDKLYKKWIVNELPGMGAAYFTKLIFFCHPDHKGYIMDQWTAKSINLLSDQDIVHLNYGYVSRKNTKENYDSFCNRLEALTFRLQKEIEQIWHNSLTDEQVEIALFSRGGHINNKWEWRKYVDGYYKRNG